MKRIFFDKARFFVTARMILLAVILMTGGCDLYEEGWTTQKRIQIEEARVFEQMPVDELSQGKIDEIAKYHARYGDGPVALSVTYDPASDSYTALAASQDMARFSGALRAGGIKALNGGILPVPGQPDEAGQVLISYATLQAKAPDGCRTMPGLENTRIEQDADYPLGCTIETLFARQVARPRDLKGQSQMETTADGRRTGNAAEFYRDGIPNEPLEGESATE